MDRKTVGTLSLSLHPSRSRSPSLSAGLTLSLSLCRALSPPLSGTNPDLGGLVHEKLDEATAHARVDHRLDLFVGPVREVRERPARVS